MVRAHQRGLLVTWPLLVVRHALAIPRSLWKGDDRKRPLSAEGYDQVPFIADALAAYGIASLVSSPSTRCVQTLRSHVARTGMATHLRVGLSEEGFIKKGPKRVVAAVNDLFDAGIPAALCSHGPVLPTVLAALVARLAPSDECVPGTDTVLTEAADLGIDKGEVLVAHVCGIGPDAVSYTHLTLPTNREV